MSSPAQIAANRANAQLSTGPVTAAGKNASSRNATKHGLSGKTLVLDSEEKIEFEALRTSLVEEWQPASAHEENLIDTLARETWRLNRLRATETGMFNNLAKDVRSRYKERCNNDNVMGIIFSDPMYRENLKLFLRYQGPIERAFYRAAEDVCRAFTARRKAEAQKAQLLAAAAGRAHLAQQLEKTHPVNEIGFVSSPALASQTVGQAASLQPVDNLVDNRL